MTCSNKCPGFYNYLKFYRALIMHFVGRSSFVTENLKQRHMLNVECYGFPYWLRAEMGGTHGGTTHAKRLSADQNVANATIVIIIFGKIRQIFNIVSYLMNILVFNFFWKAFVKL